MRAPLTLLSKLIVVFAVSLALAGVSFAHRSVDTRTLDPSYLAFIAAGGTAQDLCEDHTAHDTAPGHSDHRAAPGCEACRLVDSVLVLALPETVRTWQVPRIAPLVLGASEIRAQSIAYRLQQGRAPPRV